MWKQTHAFKGFIYGRCCFCREDFLNRKFFVRRTSMLLLSLRCKFTLSLSKDTLLRSLLQQFRFCLFSLIFTITEVFVCFGLAGCRYYIYDISIGRSRNDEYSGVLRFFFVYRSARHCESDRLLFNCSRMLSRPKQS